jgi:NADH-quinone oxidoreductase subunit G
MAKITIDGKVYDVENNLTIIQAAREQGISIPHFCWHPALSVAGNCRMCLVEVEKMPKLVIACATQVVDGMVVKTKSDRVVNAQQAVMEFLLINHPLDCPICDEAGECKLQSYTYKFSVGISRFEFDKVRKPKRVALGPNVMLDVERCIMCSRCIRFCDEIAKKPQLVFTQRGDHVELTTAPGEQLDNPYSMNVIELCPVGALTSRDFRFKARVWDMSSTETICVGCARGCNTNMWVRNNEILRLTPRRNTAVNDYWLCDHGRLNTFKHVNAGDRIKAPMIRKEGKLVEVGWDEAIAAVASALKGFKKNEIAGLGSAYATNEDSYVFSRLMKEVVGTKNVDFVRHVNESDEDDLLIRADRTPNSLGAMEAGVRPADGGLTAAGILRAIRDGQIRALYLLDDRVAGDPTIAGYFAKLDLLILHASNHTEATQLADVVLSNSTYAEQHGTMTNFEGRIQRLRPAVATVEMDRALDGLSMSRLDRFGAHNDRWMKSARRDARPSWRILKGVASALGTKWKYNMAEEVFAEMAQKIDAFKGLNYQKVGMKGTTLKRKAEASTAPAR